MSNDMRHIMENWRVYEGFSRMTLDEAKEAPEKTKYAILSILLKY